jgi:hypothetical protein
MKCPQSHTTCPGREQVLLSTLMLLPAADPFPLPNVMLTTAQSQEIMMSTSTRFSWTTLQACF